MPKLRNTENYILTEMDEREREEFHRLKMVKAKKTRTRAFASSRYDRHPEETSDTSDLSSASSVTRMRSLDCLTVTSILYPCTGALSTTTDSGDFKPICYPHNWDDDDLLF